MWGLELTLAILKEWPGSKDSDFDFIWVMKIILSDAGAHGYMLDFSAEEILRAGQKWAKWENLPLKQRLQESGVSS